VSSLVWKLNRLRVMGVPEIAYRLRHAAQAQWERRGLGLARPGAPGETCGRAWLAELPRDFDVSVYRAAADRVLAGRFDVFAMKDAALGFPPDWNRDPKTGTVAPLTFGKTLNYRDERIVGDIKYLWEPNRHAELVTLAQAWHLTGDEQYAEGCRTLLESWFEQCPYPLGVNWTSSLEHGVRLVSWAVAWGLLAGKPPGPAGHPPCQGGMSSPLDKGGGRASDRGISEGCVSGTVVGVDLNPPAATRPPPLSGGRPPGAADHSSSQGVDTLACLHPLDQPGKASGFDGLVGLQELLGRDFVGQWLDAIYRHCHFIAGHFSRHSSANNHLLGELMGLFVASLTWPCWPESARWRARARTEFEAEALKQTAPDGVNREQAIWYHHEVADMMLLVGLFGRANGVEFSPAFWERLERMLDFIAALMDVGGNVPMIGDADDAQMVRWVPEAFSPSPPASPRPSPLEGEGEMRVPGPSPLDVYGGVRVYRSLLATGAVLFDRPDLAAKAGWFDDKSRWLLGDGAQARFEALVRQGGETRWARAYPEGGYYVLGADLDTPAEIRLVADAAPLGYLSIAAHGHADALAFTLSVAGREMLIDPGTYTYNTQRKWRDYFKGTCAHNTVRVDGVDQSVSGGNFLWVKHANARCEHWECGSNRDVLVGAHDGYLRLGDPVRHRRTLMLDKATRKLHVTDRLECTGRHRIEVLFHVGETCLVENAESFVRIQNGPVQIRLRNQFPGWQAEVVNGQESPPLGWVSRRFDEKLPTHTIVWTGEIFGTTELRTELEIEIEGGSLQRQ